LSEVNTPSQTSGPLFGYAMLWEGSEAAVDPARPDAFVLSAHLYDAEGAPIGWPEAMVEVWVADQFARTRTDRDGRFEVVVAKAAPAPLDDELAQAPHVNIQIFGRGLLKQLVTRAYFADEAEANAADPVLGAVAPELRERLIAVPDERGYHLDLFAAGERESVFFEF